MISVPEVMMPWPATPPHPAEDEAAAALRQWADDAGVLHDPGRRAILAMAKPAHVAARLYPVAPPTALTLASAWLAVNFLVDDLLDADDDPDSCASTATGLLAVVDPASPGLGPAAADPLHVAVTRLWGRTAAGRPADWCEAFRADYANWLCSYALEAADRASGRVPPIAEYRRRRRQSSGMLVFATLAEVTADAELPASSRGCYPIRTLRDRAAEYMGLVNDLYSVDKEFKSGQFHNAVCVVMHHDGAGLEQARQAVAGMAADCVAAFTGAARALDPDGPAARCAAGYRRMMRGAVDCCAELERYAPEPIEPWQGVRP